MESSDPEDRNAATRAFAIELMQRGALALVVVLSTPMKNVPRCWNPYGVLLPVCFVQSSENCTGLLEAATIGLKSSLIRAPIEADLAYTFKVLADSDGNRPGLCALARKLLKLADLDALALCENIMEPTPEMYSAPEAQRKAWAPALVDLVCYICIYQAAHAQELGQAPVHAERAGAGENRMVKAMGALRTQIAHIQRMALQWAYIELPRTLGVQGLPLAVRKLVFREKAHSYSSAQDPLENPVSTF